MSVGQNSTGTIRAPQCIQESVRQPGRWLLVAGLTLLGLTVLIPSRTPAAGVTLITHGLNGNVDDWVTAMAEQVTNYATFPGRSFTLYKIYFVPSDGSYAPAWMRLRGAAPNATDSGEIMVALDWGPLASGDRTTIEVAALLAPKLLDTNFIAELNGHALAELPIHLVGHSRGGSLVCQLSQLLGTNGVWVDHLTTLDPHPLNEDGFNDFIYPATDAPCRTYENVLFHDNYYQLINIFFYGEPVAGAYVRRLTNLDGGYGGFAGAHSDVHLWYHGTIDFRLPASDYAASLGGSERQGWWTSLENTGRVAGFNYSLIGGGSRVATNRPAGGGTARLVDGYNQRWDLGAGAANNRTALPPNGGGWPNIVKLNLSGTNLLAFGQTNTVRLYYQWARSSPSNASVGIYLDPDPNPFNGNERLLHELEATGTGTTEIGTANIEVPVTGANAATGTHFICARITDGGRTRHAYAPELLTVVSSWEPLTLEIVSRPQGQTQVDVVGVPGQRFILQWNTAVTNWQSLSTNWLSGNRWTHLEPMGAAGFYRAVLR